MQSDIRTMKNPELLKRFAPYYKKYIPILLFDLFCAAVTTLADVALPLIVRNITQLAIDDAAALTIAYVLRIGLFYIALRVMDAAADYYMTAQGHIMGSYIERDMRFDLFSHLQKLGFAYYSDAKVGQIMARITSDLFEITEFAHHFPEEMFIATIKIVAAFVILFGINPLLTLIVFASLPLMYLIARYYRDRLRRTFQERRHQLGEINAQVEDSLLGIRVVKSFANEPLEIEKFRQGNDKFINIKRKGYKLLAGFSMSRRIVDGMMYIVVVIAGALFLRDGAITAGDYVAFLLFVSTLLASIRRIVEFTEQFQNGMTSIERFCTLMDESPDVKDLAHAKALSNVKGEVTFENVSFHYSDKDRDVLADINLKVPAGERVALVGPSGSGKTTLCNLIPRFYNLSDGRILIDGQDITTLTQRSLRENIGVVQQDVYLFSGTVFDNIVYGLPGAAEDAVMEAAKLAGAHEFITALPNGYHTYVGERGVKLSGGQKQRISIARVFLKNPPILILDEATSALDNENERIVQKSLETLSKGRTTFTIAHRLTTIKNASTICVLTEKGIEEQGSHKELIQKGGVYASLYRMYMEEA